MRRSSVALYVLVLSASFDLATLPFSFYRGFLLERRYGLATETLGHWLKDHLKAVLIGLLFAELGATFVYFTLRHWPGYWWVLAGLGYSLVMLILINLAPVVLLPLFYTFKPLERAELRDRLTALASKTGARIMGVYEWTLSDRTKKANAALTGMGNTRRILLSDTLLAEYSDDEIEVILAHELAHHVHKDIWTSVVYDMVLMFAGFFAGASGAAVGGAVLWSAQCGGSGGHSGPADDRRRRGAGCEAGDECHLARARTPRGRVRAANDEQSAGVHFGDAQAGAAESCRGESLTPRPGVLLYASARSKKGLGPRRTGRLLPRCNVSGLYVRVGSRILRTEGGPTSYFLLPTS